MAGGIEPLTENDRIDWVHACIRYTIELRINKGTARLLLMGRGDFSRPYLGRLKPPLPETKAQKKVHYFCEAH